jgi:hypothetical protein
MSVGEYESGICEKRQPKAASLLSTAKTCLLEHEDVFLRADLLQDFGPHGDADFSQVSLAEQEHQGAGLADTAADRERNPVIENGVVVRKPQEVELLGQFELLFGGILRHADSHRGQFVATLGHRIPHEDVAVQAMRGFAHFLAGVGDPVVVVGGAHLVGIAVFQWSAGADDEDGGTFLKNRRLALLPGQVRIQIEKFLRLQEDEFLGKARITRVLELRGTSPVRTARPRRSLSRSCEPRPSGNRGCSARR